MRFDIAFFRFLCFLAVLRLPFCDLVVLIVVKKMSRKNDAKSDQKGEREPCGEKLRGEGGSLKTIETRHQNIRNQDNASNTPWRA